MTARVQGCKKDADGNTKDMWIWASASGSYLCFAIGILVGLEICSRPSFCTALHAKVPLRVNYFWTRARMASAMQRKRTPPPIPLATFNANQ